MPIRSAFRPISFIIRGCIGLPITLHENKSRTSQRYSKPSRIRIRLCLLSNVHPVLPGWTAAGSCWASQYWLHLYRLGDFSIRPELFCFNRHALFTTHCCPVDINLAKAINTVWIRPNWLLCPLRFRSAWCPCECAYLDPLGFTSTTWQSRQTGQQRLLSQTKVYLSRTALQRTSRLLLLCPIRQ